MANLTILPVPFASGPEEHVRMPHTPAAQRRRPDAVEIDVDAWFSPAQVAELCGVHPKTISRWHRRGWLPATVTPGGQRRFAGVDVARHLAGDPTDTRAGDVPLVTSELLEDLYVRQGLNQRMIAARLGIHQRTVWAALRAAGIPARRRGSWVLAGGPEGLPRDVLEDLYMRQRLSYSAIGKRLGVSRGTVPKHLARAGIPLRGDVEIPRDVLEDLYVTQRLGHRAVARQLGVSVDQVRAARRRHGIAARGPGRIPTDRVPPQDELEDLYVRQGLSIPAIAQRVGVSKETISDRLHRYGIPRRDPAAAARARQHQRLSP